MTTTATDEEIASQIIWTVHGVGVCVSCRMPSHLFLSNLSPSDSSPECGSCATRSQRQALIVLHPGLDWADADSISFLSLGEQYDYRTLGMTEWCEVCVRPFIEDDPHYSPTTAVDAEGVELRVHKKCSSVTDCSHDECSGKRVVTGWRSHAQQYPYRTVPTANWSPEHFQYGNGNNYCSKHFKIWLEEEGEGNVFYCDSCSDAYNYRYYDSLRYYDNIYCGGCRDELFFYCNECDSHVHSDDELDHSCRQEYSVIHSYGYKPVPCFFDSKEPEPIRYHLGFELEVEHRNEESCHDVAVGVQDILGSRAYLKYDGSLEEGFEIVTHPHTLTEYKKNFPWEFIEHAKSQRLVSWNSPRCGFHVHVSRYAFGPGMRPGESENDYYKRTIIVRQQHELKFIKLIYDNERQVQRLAGRKSDWAKFTDKGNIWRKVKHNYQSDGHYSAVNVENYNTIEVRVFKGSLKRERLLANLEFVHSAVEYTRNLRVTTNKALSWVAYSGFVYQNADRYPNLLELMVKVGNQEIVYDNRTEDGE